MIASRVASSFVQRQVKYVVPVPVSAATGLVSTVYGQIADEMRLVIPPALLHSPAPDLLAAYWMLNREPMLPTGSVDRATKEAVAAAVSVANICPYCVDMHSVGMYDLSTENDAEATAGDRIAEISDPRLRGAAAWARVAHQTGAAAGLPATITSAAHAELVGLVVSMHYINRMVNVFLANFLLPPGLPPRSRRRLKRGLSMVLRPMLRASYQPGRSLDLLPPAPPPPGTEWATGNPAIAQALARSSAAFQAAGLRSVPPAVREIVLDRLARWQGAETGLSTAWCEELVAGLPPPDRAAGRLALLAALASYQVDGEVIGEFRRHHPADRTVVDVAAWASFAAASTIGSRQGTLARRDRHGTSPTG
jgi:alkylhydroperoxidase family enzyme